GSVHTGWDGYFIDDVSLPIPRSEECDDGNTAGGDGCSPACTVEVCGNGIRDVGEECDDGNTAAEDGCSPACRLEYCGDGTTGTVFSSTDGLETGDLSRLPWVQGTPHRFEPVRTRARTGSYSLGPTNIGVHSSTARVSVRGTGGGRVCFWYAGESESCCDRFRFAVDGTTLLDRGGSDTTWTEFCTDVSPGAHEYVWTYQKDGSVHTGWDGYFIDDVSLPIPRSEECDDGNTTAGDGCSPGCTVEICGNGILDIGEQCDDGNTAPGDLCTPACVLGLCGDGDIAWSRPSDGFETGNLSQLPWAPGAGTSGFEVLLAPAEAQSGRHLLRSRNSGRSGSTAFVELRLDLREAGQVCFRYRGESESCCDYFRFRVDGAERLSAAGFVSWTEACHPVAAGARTLRWEYSKDLTVNTGIDAFSIDDVRLPAVQEACDDGNAVPGDGCDSNCRVE
ncbi:MAG: hypothetical protein QME96_13600, partial [Myxococcota bacterium]|nr:hypothetical protein [Myxococcota bacterium]